MTVSGLPDGPVTVGVEAFPSRDPATAGAIHRRRPHAAGPDHRPTGRRGAAGAAVHRHHHRHCGRQRVGRRGGRVAVRRWRDHRRLRDHQLVGRRTAARPGTAHRVLPGARQHRQRRPDAERHRPGRRHHPAGTRHRRAGGGGDPPAGRGPGDVRAARYRIRHPERRRAGGVVARRRDRLHRSHREGGRLVDLERASPDHRCREPHDHRAGYGPGHARQCHHAAARGRRRRALPAAGSRRGVQPGGVPGRPARLRDPPRQGVGRRSRSSPGSCWSTPTCNRSPTW